MPLCASRFFTSCSTPTHSATSATSHSGDPAAEPYVINDPAAACAARPSFFDRRLCTSLARSQASCRASLAPLVAGWSLLAAERPRCAYPHREAAVNAPQPRLRPRQHATGAAAAGVRTLAQCARRKRGFVESCRPDRVRLRRGGSSACPEPLDGLTGSTRDVLRFSAQGIAASGAASTRQSPFLGRTGDHFSGARRALEGGS